MSTRTVAGASAASNRTGARSARRMIPSTSPDSTRPGSSASRAVDDASPSSWAKAATGTKNGPTSVKDPDDDTPLRPNGSENQRGSAGSAGVTSAATRRSSPPERPDAGGSSRTRSPTSSPNRAAASAWSAAGTGDDAPGASSRARSPATTRHRSSPTNVATRVITVVPVSAPSAPDGGRSSIGGSVMRNDGDTANSAVSNAARAPVPAITSATSLAGARVVTSIVRSLASASSIVRCTPTVTIASR